MELFLKVVYQVLSPIQAAQFVVESFPYHCDVLAMANVLSTVFGKDVVGGGTSTLSGGVNLANGVNGSSKPAASSLSGPKDGGIMNIGLNLSKPAAGDSYNVMMSSRFSSYCATYPLRSNDGTCLLDYA